MELLRCVLKPELWQTIDFFLAEREPSPFSPNGLRFQMPQTSAAAIASQEKQEVSSPFPKFVGQNWACLGSTSFWDPTAWWNSLYLDLSKVSTAMLAQGGKSSESSSTLNSVYVKAWSLLTKQSVAPVTSVQHLICAYLEAVLFSLRYSSW